MSPGATPGVDIDLLDREVTFAPGEWVKPVPISALNDDEWEETERFGLTLTDPKSGERVGPNTPLELTVYENVGQLYGEPQGDEFGGLTFTLKRIQGLQHAVTVTYRTRPDADTANSAVAGVDYLAAEGTISFAPGEETKTIRIATIDNQRLETSARWFRFEFDSSSPYLIGNSFRLWIPDDEPLAVSSVGNGPTRVSEGDVFRLQLMRSGELAGDTRVSLRHRLVLRPCDDTTFYDHTLGANGLPANWELVSEGIVDGFGPQDRTLWLELIAPDDTQLQATNRCLTVLLDSPNRPDAMGVWATDLELADNETQFVEGGTGVLPGNSDEPAFVPLPDGSAYVLDWDRDGIPMLSRVRPELDRDPDFLPQIPAGLAPTAIAPRPDGGLTIAAFDSKDQRWTLLALDRQGRANPGFRPELPLQSISVIKTTSEGLIYLTDGGRLVRLKPDGNIDPDFQEPVIQGAIERIWLDGPTAYLGGRFTNFAGLQRTNLGLIRIQGNGTPDREFIGLVQNSEWSIRELVPLQSGPVLVIESHYIENVNVLQVRETNGGVITEQSDEQFELAAHGGKGRHQPGNINGISAGQFEHLARLGNGRVFRASGGYWCGNINCSINRSLVELPRGASGLGDWMDVLPPRGMRGFVTDARQRVFGAGEYLWIQEPDAHTYRRLRFLDEDETAFGLVPGTESGLPSQGCRLVAAVRRYASMSGHAATTTVQVTMARSDSQSAFEPFEVPVTFAVGEVTKPILLPEGFHFTPDSLSEIRVTLSPPAGPRLGGTTEMSSLMVGVPEQPAAYRLAIHRLGETIAGEPPLLTLTGPLGSYRVDACMDLTNKADPWAWTEVYSNEWGWFWDDAPVFRLSPDAPTAVLPLPFQFEGAERLFLRAGAEE